VKLRTEISLPSYSSKIDFDSKIFGLGSCFVDNIKEKLDYYFLPNMINPFGVSFNPYSIKKLMERIVNKDFFLESDLFFHENLWKNFQLHSQNNHPEKTIFLNKANDVLSQSHDFLKSANWIFITLGTAWAYKHKSNNEIVNNCHKVPQKEFIKELLTPEFITNNLLEIIDLVKHINPTAKFLFSISPVRHLKDGFVENNRSKSHLHTALHPIIDNKDLFYFPSYEILIDDLRDYRFYARDLLHPNDLAIDYIWEKFQNSLIDPKIYEDLKIIDKIQKQLLHRSFHTKSVISAKLEEKIKKIQNKYPQIRFSY
jgi:hypothetical protein